MIELDDIANEQQLVAGVTGPEDADTLYLLDGTAVFSFQGEAEERWRRDTLEFPIGPTFREGEVIRATASGSLASIYNDEVSHDAGWAVDRVDADFDDESNRVILEADLAVRDTDGFVLRMAYHANILARGGRAQ